MELSATKIELIELLLKTDEDLILQKIKTILQNGFYPAKVDSLSFFEKPLDEGEYNEKLKKSEKDFKNRRIVSHEEIKKKYNHLNE